MNVALYSCSASHNKINKSSYLTNKTDIEDVRFFEDKALNITRPEILVKITDTISDISKYNYMYIPKLGRYYFIINILAENGLLRIVGECDVLYSFRNDILSSDQFITRSQTKPNYMMIDQKLPMRSDNNYLFKSFGLPCFDKKCYHLVLETVGSGQGGLD